MYSRRPGGMSWHFPQLETGDGGGGPDSKLTLADPRTRLRERGGFPPTFPLLAALVLDHYVRDTQPYHR